MLGAVFTMVSGNSRFPIEKLAHGLDLMLTSVMTTNILQYIFGKCTTEGSHFRRLAPFYIMLLATLLMLLQPLSDFTLDSLGCDGVFTAEQLHNGGTESKRTLKLPVHHP